MSASSPQAPPAEKSQRAEKPSHVFFGEMCGTSGCLPISEPVRYAPMSLNFVTTTSQST